MKINNITYSNQSFKKRTKANNITVKQPLNSVNRYITKNYSTRYEELSEKDLISHTRLLTKLCKQLQNIIIGSKMSHMEISRIIKPSQIVLNNIRTRVKSILNAKQLYGDDVKINQRQVSKIYSDLFKDWEV